MTLTRIVWLFGVVFPAGVLIASSPEVSVPLSFERGTRSSEFVAHIGGASILLTSAGASISQERMRLVGARANAYAEPEELLAGYSNYLGADPKNWRTHVPNYGRVRYRNIYPGIDVVYYGSPRELEFDFIVSPGADPRAIQLALSDPGLQIRLPHVYQAGREVEARAVRHGNRVRFQVSAYDRSRPLVIDPVLSFASVFGGGSWDGGQAIAVDANGAVYVVGNTSSGNFPANNRQSVGYTFLAKLNSAGNTLIYATYLPAFSGGPSVAVSASGSVYIAGQSGPESPLIGPAPLRACTFAGGPKIYLAKLSPDGASLVYSGCLGGSFPDYANAIAVDGAENAYVTGFTQSPDFPLVHALQSDHPPGQGFLLGFVLKLGPTGAVLYSTYLGGGAGDFPRAIAVDATGNVYVTGQTSSANFPLKNAIQDHMRGSLSAGFIAKIKADGSDLVYSTFFGGSNGNSGTAIAADAMGNAYVAGYTSSADLPTTTNALQSRFNAILAFRSTDGAANWFQSDFGLPSPPSNLLVDSRNPATVYALTALGLFKTTDRGATWLAIAAVPAGGLWISPVDSTLYLSTGTGNLLRSRDGGANFTTLKTGFTGFLNQLVFDPRDPLAIYGRWGGEGPGDGIYKSTDGGDTWKATGLVGAGSGRGGFAIDPAHPSILYATTVRNGLQRTDDGGDTWAKVDTGASPTDVQIDSGSKLFVVAGNVILVGSDRAFVSKTAPGFVNRLVIDPNNSATLYVVSFISGGASAIYKSTDGGDTWRIQNTGLPSSPLIQALSIDPQSPETLYLGIGAEPDGFLAKLSADGSKLLYSTYLGGTGADMVNAIAVDGADNTYLIGTSSSRDFPLKAQFRTGGSGFVTKIDSEGLLGWSSFLGGGNPHGIALGSAGEVYLAGDTSDTGFATPDSIQKFSSDNFFRSNDRGATWTGTTFSSTPPFLGVNAVLVDPLTPSRVLAISDRLNASEDRGQTFQPLGKPGFLPISPLTVVVDPVNPATIYVGGYPNGGGAGVSRSTDGGATWTPENTLPGVVYGLAIDPKTPSTLYAALYYPGMYKSTDSGVTWQPIGPLPLAATVAVDPRNSDVVYASAGSDVPRPNTGGSVYRSTDGGTTWVAINKGLPPGWYANILLVDHAVPGRLYAAKSFFDGGIYRSDNGGTDWIAIGAGLPDQVLKVITIDPGNSATLYAGPSSGGLYRSLDSGATWKLLPGLQLPIVTAIAVDPADSSVLYAGAQSNPSDAFVMKIVQ